MNNKKKNVTVLRNQRFRKEIELRENLPRRTFYIDIIGNVNNAELFI